MKVLLVNGSPHKNGCTYTALHEVEKELNKCGIETEIFWIGAKPAMGCTACYKCMETKRCWYDGDRVNEFIGKVPEADGLVFGSPIYYAGISGQLKSFLDRAFVCKAGLYNGKPAAGVVSCRRGGAMGGWQDINHFFGMTNMPVVTSQYWNQVHGNRPEEVLQDAEGLQTMRRLAQNMAWMLRCIDAGRKAGVPEPVAEQPIKTNFIR